jgi:hypothetical protein
MQRRFLLPLVALTVALAAAVAALSATAGTAVRLPAGCFQDTARVSACRLVAHYFDDVNTGREQKACALLGATLRRQSGGPECPRLMAMSRGTPATILSARNARTRVDLVVRVGLRELDHYRMLRWFTLVGYEGGRLKILATARMA